MNLPGVFCLLNYERPELNKFLPGFIAGVGAILVLALLVRLLLYFFGRSRRVQGLTVSGENGSLFISAGAIYDYIRAKVGEIEAVRFSRVILLKGNQGFSLEIHIDFDVNTQALPTVIETLRTNLSTGLKSVFGITDIEAIHVKVKRARI